jgi:hypothetical protein
VLRDRQQLDVSEACPLDIIRQHVRGFAIAQEVAVGFAPPGAEVQLVGGHRRIERVGVRAPLHPLGITPIVIELPCTRRGGRRLLRVQGERVGLFADVSLVLRFDSVLVRLAGPDAGNESFPDARVVGARR